MDLAVAMDLVVDMDFTEGTGITVAMVADGMVTTDGEGGVPGGGALQHGHITGVPRVTPTMVMRVTPTIVVRTMRNTPAIVIRTLSVTRAR
jgi:ABC-type amino acid transport system permease subunit